MQSLFPHFLNLSVISNVSAPYPRNLCKYLQNFFKKQDKSYGFFWFSLKKHRNNRFQIQQKQGLRQHFLSVRPFPDGTIEPHLFFLAFSLPLSAENADIFLHILPIFLPFQWPFFML